MAANIGVPIPSARLSALAAKSVKADAQRTRWSVKLNEVNAEIWRILDAALIRGGEYQFTDGKYKGRWCRLTSELQSSTWGRERGYASAELLNSRTRKCTGKSVRMYVWLTSAPDTEVRIDAD